MYRWKGRVAVVTGASSGIGLAVAKALLQKGLVVIGLARRKHKMEMDMEDMNKSGHFHALKCDVSKEQEVIDAFERVKSDFGTVQILVNNAGLITGGSLYETSRSDWEKVFNVNVMGLLECTKQAILMMKEANVDGHIVNINSVQGYRIYNYEPRRFNVYAATKHAVTAITETLQNDLLDSKIRVTSIAPGYTDTDLLSFTGLGIKMMNQRNLKPEDIAESVLYTISTLPHLQVAHLIIKPCGEYRH